jgi:signal transduction histidine kinase
MPNRVDSIYLSQSIAAQIRELLAIDGAIVQQLNSTLIPTQTDEPPAKDYRWHTLAQYPHAAILPRSIFSKDSEANWEKLSEVDARLESGEIVEFTVDTSVMNIGICSRYAFIPIFDRHRLWGRICAIGQRATHWQERDLVWARALGEQLARQVGRSSAVLADPEIVPPPPPTNEGRWQQRLAELEDLLLEKDEFIDRISHDLRAPLMNIKMAAKMVKLSLNNDPVVAMLIEDSRTRKYIQMLEDECDREVDLIDRILDLQRLDLDKVGLRLDAIDLEAWLPDAISGFVARTIDRQQYLSSVCESGLPPIETDLHQLGKIAIELLNNACKYTDRGGQIKVRIGRTVGTRDRITLAVSNQASIAPEHLEHIFDRFYRIPGADKHQQGGNGLGLALVQKVVGQLGGNISAESNNGWTHFSIDLPIEFSTPVDNSRLTPM